MNRALLLLVVPSFFAFAEDAPCTPGNVDASVEVNLKKGTKLKEVAALYRQLTCRGFELPAEAAELPIAIAVEGKVPYLHLIDVVRAASASAGYDVREDYLVTVAEKAKCDPVKASAMLEQVAKASTCAIDFDALGCADYRVTLDDTGGKLKVSALGEGTILHAIGLRVGDELVDTRATLPIVPNKSFELKVVRAGAPKTLRCEFSGRKVHMHPSIVLTNGLPPGPGSKCWLDPRALNTMGDTIEIDSAKTQALEWTCFIGHHRTMPVLRDGKVQGLKMFAIAPNTLPALLGLQNGDTLKSLNGRELGTRENDSAELFKALRNEKKFTLGIERQGAPKTLTIILK